MIDTRLLFNRDVVLETAPDGVAVAGAVLPVPGRYVRAFLNSGVATVPPGEEEIPTPTAIITKDLVPEPEPEPAPEPEQPATKDPGPAPEPARSGRNR